MRSDKAAYVYLGAKTLVLDSALWGEISLTQALCGVETSFGIKT